MKYLLLIAVVVVACMFWRAQRRAKEGADHAAGPAPPTALPQDMVRCQFCALHLPRAEATVGPHDRVYCSREHLLADKGAGAG